MSCYTARIGGQGDSFRCRNPSVKVRVSLKVAITGGHAPILDPMARGGGRQPLAGTVLVTSTPHYLSRAVRLTSSVRKLIDINVYTVVQAPCAWPELAARDQMEITMDLILTEHNFHLDSFNRRSDLPDQ